MLMERKGEDDKSGWKKAEIILSFWKLPRVEYPDDVKNPNPTSPLELAYPTPTLILPDFDSSGLCDVVYQSYVMPITPEYRW